MRIERSRQSVLRSGAFRFALLFAAVFAIGSLLLLIAVERQIGRYAIEATDQSLRAEAGNLAAEYRAHGRQGLIDAIHRHAALGKDAPFHYLLVDTLGTRIAGDLPVDTPIDGWGTVPVDEHRHRGSRPYFETFKTLATHLPQGLRLVVATDTFDVQELTDRLGRFTLACGIGITLFALVGGYFVGGLFVRRLDRVNGSVDRIMAGALAERLPAIGISPEFDQLSRNLNLMLHRIGNLMEGLRQVSTDIAHDLRTPLTRLRQQLEETRGMADPAAYEAGIDTAIEQVDEILRIFRALLRIGTLEGGAGRERLAEVDLSEVMDRVHLACQPVAEDAGKTLFAQHAPGVTVRGDGELLAQLFINLIENALVHTPAGTRITTRLARTGHGILAEVADDGPGVPDDMREKILQRFYRLDRSRSSPGAGLGLSLVSAIAALHGAALTLADNRPGLRVSLAFPDQAEPE
ncbi:sensor histidine kinase [Flavisphingomonas formosensis]|uniref:sensor histidine kinase n=1 Tax=Flavisphingomonas formosensis TaxID=861534 RepID=UPI0012F7BE73|nr:ATP-binding protein [Sphingomonas formosensis]